MWYGWTTRKTQPMHIDPALQMLIDQSVQLSPSAVSSTYIGRDVGTPAPTTESKGSQEPAWDIEPPFPTPAPDANMQHSADKRSRDSPDSTLKPEHKSLKTSGVAVATDEDTRAMLAKTQPDIPPQTIRWNVREKAEVRVTVWRLHHSTPVDLVEFKGVTMECAIESTPHEKASIYTSVLEGGHLMQSFESEDPQEMQDNGMPQMPVAQCTSSRAYMKMTAMP